MAQGTASGAAYKRSGRLLYRKYREFFLPTMLASISSSMSLIVDSIIVGNMLGPAQMASVNLCLPVFQAHIACAILLGMGASALIAIALGSRDNRTADAVFSTSVTLLLVCGVLVSLVMAPFADSVARLITSDSLLEPMVADYLEVLLYGSTFIMAVPAFSYILRTDGMVKLASVSLVVANLTNLLLDVVFIGPFRMGIAGSALATVCGYVAGFATLAVYVRSKRRTLHFIPMWRMRWRENAARIGQIIRAGFPGALSSVLITIKIFFINYLVGRISGHEGLAVFSVCLSCLSFVSMFISGTAGAMMPIAGALYGERDFKGVRLIFRYTLSLALVLTAVIVLLFELVPAPVFSLFGVAEPGILALGIPSLRLFAVSLFGVTVSFLMIYYYMTVKRHSIADALSVTEGLLVIVPAAWLFSSIMGIQGIWVAFIVAETVSLAVLYLMTRRVKRRSGNGGLDMLLIERSAPELLYDVSLSATGQDAVRLSAEAMDVLTDAGLDKSIAMKAGIALEEMVVNMSAFPRNRGRRVDVDVRIALDGNDLLVSMRDNGASFNPSEYRPEETDFSIDGIALLRMLAVEIKYSRVLALNQTLITIRKNTK